MSACLFATGTQRQRQGHLWRRPPEKTARMCAVWVGSVCARTAPGRARQRDSACQTEKFYRGEISSRPSRPVVQWQVRTAWHMSRLTPLWGDRRTERTSWRGEAQDQRDARRPARELLATPLGPVLRTCGGEALPIIAAISLDSTSRFLVRICRSAHPAMRHRIPGSAPYA